MAFQNRREGANWGSLKHPHRRCIGRVLDEFVHALPSKKMPGIGGNGETFVLRLMQQRIKVWRGDRLADAGNAPRSGEMNTPSGVNARK